MQTLDDYERAYEAKFAHDAEMQFRVEARRDRLVGLWAAELLGKSGAEADAYARAVIKADLEEPGAEDVLAKLTADLTGIATRDEIATKMAACLRKAKEQMLEEA